MKNRSEVADLILRLRSNGYKLGDEFLVEVKREFPEYYQAYQVWSVKWDEMRVAYEAMEELTGHLREAVFTDDFED
jgi:hypothetical protein